MSGHSHWARIKHKKAVTDARRGKHFSKVARIIIVAARRGGGDPNMNLSLRYAIDKARSINMTNDAIDRAIKRGTGEGGGANYEEVVYEGYGPAGVAVYCEALTDNRNRTVGEVRKIFEMSGGSLGGPNSVGWMFHKKGIIAIPAEGTTEDALIEMALEAGAEDVTSTPDGFEVTCAPTAFDAVKKALTDRGLNITSAEISMIPQNTVKLESEAAGKVMRLIENLEENDDVQNVYANFDIPEEVMAQLSK
jgi:YebC/PmpR family DNA-binding regulatory protein